MQRNVYRLNPFDSIIIDVIWAISELMLVGIIWPVPPVIFHLAFKWMRATVVVVYETNKNQL